MTERDEDVLVGERVMMRQPQRGDGPRLIEFYRANAEHLSAVEPLRPPEFYTEEWWNERIDEMARDFAEGRSWHNLLFMDGEPERVIGTVNFFNFVRGAFQACTLGYALDRGHQGRGLMSEAVSLGIAHAFGSMNFHRIMANYLPGNIRSATLLAKLGFVAEGYARRYLNVGGRWQDFVTTSLINEDWRPV